MFELLAEISGRRIDDMGDWPVMVERLLVELGKPPYRENETVKRLLVDNPHNIYVTGENFWAELKEMT